ncbi:hypothetical protein AJ87_09950 [Rhizobium yanglingense]|nr:hypothetical protein AJ87_09950 [Rhizobium yanglingense]
MYRKKINVSTVLAGQKLGIKDIDEGIWLIGFMHYDQGYIDLCLRLDTRGIGAPERVKLGTAMSLSVLYSSAAAVWMVFCHTSRRPERGTSDTSGLSRSVKRRSRLGPFETFVIRGRH